MTELVQLKKPKRKRLNSKQKQYIDKYFECGKGVAEGGKVVVEAYQQVYGCKYSTARAHAFNAIKELKETKYYKAREAKIIGTLDVKKIEKCKISFENVVEFAKDVREEAFGDKQYKTALIANDQIAKLYGYYSEGKRKEEEEALTPLNVVNIKMS